jgi:hypothetical protein
MPLDPTLRAAVENLNDALQTAVLRAEHVARVSFSTAEDGRALVNDLQRAVIAVQRLRNGGAQ